VTLLTLPVPATGSAYLASRSWGLKLAVGPGASTKPHDKLQSSEACSASVES